MYCFKCGAKVPDGAKFCSSCGAQLIDDPSAKEPTIPEEIRSEPSVAPDSKMTQVEEVSEDTKVQGTSEGLPKKKSTVKSIIELVLGAIILIAFLLSSTGVLNKQLVGEVGMKADYERQTSDISAVLTRLNAERAELANGVDNEHPALVAFMKYQNIEALNREILVELVDYIKVYENGNISVKFKFADELRKIAEYIEINTTEDTAVAG